MSSIVNEEIINQFHRDGFAVIPNFLSPLEVEELKRATVEVVNKYCQDMPLTIFQGGSTGQVVIEDKGKALNKIGHALHKFESSFRSATFSDKVKEVVQKLTKITKPTVIQSMVIFKHPKVGGEVFAHQDATYLYTEPIQGSLLGFWIALDEANIENGCLHFSPGSHQAGKVYQRFHRNVDQNLSKAFAHSGEDVPRIPKEQLVGAPAKPGDLVLIDGLVIHQSESNTSEHPRLAYTFHVIDMNTSYSPGNWLQPTAAETFMEL